ncbi:GntR family transcriptional regulator [Occultella glacieicola]|uniref:GntR family transcriptional regulator n=1 Tax=Occultella glacieicola TaxID=2518684 RepID=A0ABY2DWM8_9MICO|nr:GntR family transcriptional regulator [Occultella glacieicola]TDE88272.1 GntR family transcriptional regulator [Occultella glacieicola]
MFDGREPIYIQIADQIRGDILAGNLAEGEQVMSTTQYATTFRINPATAAKAFAQLVDEGVLYKQRGVGMFVAEGAPARLRSDRRETFLAERLEPVLAEARVLGIGSADLIRWIERAGDDPEQTTTEDTTTEGEQR